MAKTKQISMVEGTPWKALILFAIPLLFGSLFQQLYHTVDTMMVGRLVSEQALSAVGTCGVLTNLLVAFSTGFSVGTGVISSQLFGAGDEKELTKNAFTSLVFLGGMGIVIAAVGIVFGEVLLKYLVSVPETLLADAAEYFRIIAVGFVFLFGYNAVASLLRSIGDSKASLYFLMISSAVNVVLDYIFIAWFQMGVAGAAWATVFSQAVSCAVSFVYMQKKYEMFRFAGKKLCVHMEDIVTLVQTGTPMALQSMVGTVFNLFMQRLVNSFGAAMTASYTVVGRYEGYMHLPTNTMNQAISTYAAQNKGAGRTERISIGLKQAILIAMAVTGVLSVGSFFLAPQIVAAFGISGQSAVYCMKHIRILAFPFLLFALYFPCTGMYQGVGKGSSATAMSSTFLVICLLLGYTLRYVPAIGEMSLMICKPVTWMIMIPINYTYYFKGKWKDVDIIGKRKIVG